MGIQDAVKGAFIKSALTHLTDGNSGSTYLGLVASGILSANINFSAVSRGFHDAESAEACGKLLAAALLIIWGIVTGRKKNV